MHIIIVGGDNTAYFLAKRFANRDYTVTIINRDAMRCQELAEQTRATVVRGDGTDVKILEEAGARRADALLAITPEDQDNLVACQIASRSFGVPRVIAIVNDPDNETVFRKLGVSVAFSATRVIGAVLDQETTFDEITALMPLARGKLTINDVRLPADAPSIGKSLSELDLSGETLIACVIRDDDALIPSGTTRLKANDHLVVISHPDRDQDDMIMLLGDPA